MRRNVRVLHADTPLAECVDLLVEDRVFAVPVVDGSGRYVGQFRKNLVFSRVLPQCATTDMKIERVTRMIHAGLIRDSMDDLRVRFAGIADEPVSGYLDNESPVLHPDQSLVTAIFYFHMGRNFLPVVDPANGMFLGEVSAWDVLRNMARKD